MYNVQCTCNIDQQLRKIKRGSDQFTLLCFAANPIYCTVGETMCGKLMHGHNCRFGCNCRGRKVTLRKEGARHPSHLFIIMIIMRTLDKPARLAVLLYFSK